MHLNDIMGAADSSNMSSTFKAVKAILEAAFKE